MSESQGFFSGNTQGMDGQPQYAGFWWRFLAFFIDNIILQVGAIVILIVPGILLAGILVGTGESAETLKVISNLLGTFAGWIISWLYYAWMESSHRQATLGKMICRLKVVKKDGSRLSFGRASARFWTRMAHVFIFSVLGLLIGGVLGYLALGGSNHFFSTEHVSVFSNKTEAVASYVGVVLGALIGLLVGSVIGYLPVLFTARKQTLHDMIASTLVVKTNK